MPTFAEFEGPIEESHLKSHENGVFHARSQVSSVHAAHTSCVDDSLNIPVVQVGHWVSSRTPCKYAVLFTNPLFGMKREQYDISIANANTYGKYVMFTDLTQGATNAIVECALNFDGHRLDAMGWKASHLILNDIVTVDTSKVTCELVWNPVPANIWIRADCFLFRMKPCAVPHAVAIHKTMPNLSEELHVASFASGNAVWTNNQSDIFVPICKEESQRMYHACMRPCCRAFLLSGQCTSEKEAVLEKVDSCFSIEKLIACL